jgi:ADP-L-glycero-D-manno-heptose 6-epimerase
MIESNVIKPSLMFQKLLEKGCHKFVYASSCSVYGNQPSPYLEDKTKIECLNCYAESKYLFEVFAKSFSELRKVSCIGLRYSNVYGSNENHKGKRASMISQIINKIKNKETVQLFKYGEQKRDWVFVQDVVSANILALNHNHSDIFNVGSGQGVSFNEIIQIISHRLNKEISIDYVDCEFLGRYQNNTCVNLQKSKLILGYQPKYNIELGMRELL